jgi:hypothetical protein
MFAQVLRSETHPSCALCAENAKPEHVNRAELAFDRAARRDDIRFPALLL